MLSLKKGKEFDGAVRNGGQWGIFRGSKLLNLFAKAREQEGLGERDQ